MKTLNCNTGNINKRSIMFEIENEFLKIAET